MSTSESTPKQSHASHIIAGERAVLAKRYAAALFDLAEEKNAVEDVSADLFALQEAIDTDEHFQAMAAHPRMPLETTEKVASAVAEKAKFHALTKSFLVQVAHNRRLAHLPDMIEAFQAELSEKRGQHVAVVKTAKALTSEQEEKLSSQLGRMIGGTVRLIVEEDQSLLGGLIIKLGSRLIDASVKGKLVNIERQLKTQREAA